MRQATNREKAAKIAEKDPFGPVDEQLDRSAASEAVNTAAMAQVHALTLLNRGAICLNTRTMDVSSVRSPHRRLFRAETLRNRHHFEPYLFGSGPEQSAQTNLTTHESLPCSLNQDLEYPGFEVEDQVWNRLLELRGSKIRKEMELKKQQRTFAVMKRKLESLQADCDSVDSQVSRTFLFLFSPSSNFWE